MLLLDAAHPPPPNEWVADMDAVGAAGGFVYVIGPFLNYTPGHVSVARAAGKIVLPIIVPGNVPTSSSAVLAALATYGFTGGPVITDLERTSEPPDQWVVELRAFLNPLGYLVDRYGTPSELGKYSPEDDNWLAMWQRTGVLNPVPVLPTGWNAWQFVNDVHINGSTYDVSVIDEQFAGATAPGVDEMTPQQDQTLTHIDQTVDHLFNYDFYESDGSTPIPAI